MWASSFQVLELLLFVFLPKKTRASFDKKKFKRKNQLWRNKNFILRKITIIDLRSHVLQRSHIPQELMNYIGNQSNQCIWDLLVVLLIQIFTTNHSSFLCSIFFLTFHSWTMVIQFGSLKLLCVNNPISTSLDSQTIHTIQSNSLHFYPLTSLLL